MEFTATYPDFPERYTYSKKDGWKKRIKGTVIGRMYTLHSQPKRRGKLLLTHAADQDPRQ